MPIPCCQICYTKYINKEGGIDEDRYEKAYKDAENDFNKNNPIVTKRTKFVKQRCTCICHQDGYNILH